jgi:cephalosporin hydroxylase
LNGKVVTVDITPQSNIKDERIDFLIGDVARLGDVLTKEYLSRLPRPWLVIEDSSHMYQHTLAALSFFHPNLMKGEYIVVEDGVIDDLGLTEQYQGGPNRAIAEFLQMHPQDYCLNAGLCDFWGYNVTWNTNGFLVKTR